jgi:DNA invertase Pin-like site-specific DNA recombinase
MTELIALVSELETKGCGFVSLKENIDTTTATGRLVFHIFASLAQFERELIQERTKAGLQAARARGKMGGRPEKLSEKDKIMIRTLMKDVHTNVSDLALRFGVGRSTIYRVCGESQKRNV